MKYHPTPYYMVSLHKKVVIAVKIGQKRQVIGLKYTKAELGSELWFLSVERTQAYPSFINITRLLVATDLIWTSIFPLSYP